MKSPRWFSGGTGRSREGDVAGWHSGQRLVVLDLDLTGIDPEVDTVTGVVWLPVEAREFALGSLRHCRCGADGRLDAADWAALLDDIGDSPIVTYNARFIRRMLERAAKQSAGATPASAWLDIASLAYGIVGEAANEIDSIVIWQERMKIDRPPRHAAVADVIAMALTLQTLLAYCDEIGIATLDDLRRLGDARVWMRG